MPFLISIFIVMPIAYYPSFVRYHPPGTDFNFLHYWWDTLTIGPWSSGSAWFLWVLLALDAIAAPLWAAAERSLRPGARQPQTVPPAVRLRPIPHSPRNR